MSSSREIIISPRSAHRIARAHAWLAATPSAHEALIVASAIEAADDLAREVAEARGALVGVHRMTLNRLVGLIAAEQIAERGLVPADGLAAEAVAARAVFNLAPTGALKYFQPVLNLPGFSRALARTMAEIRWNNISAGQLRAIGESGSS